MKGVLGMEHISDEAQCRGPRGRAPLMGTLGFERKALRTDISLHGGSVGQTGVGSTTGDFERRLMEALEVKRLSLSLWELFEGNLEGGLPCWRP